MSLRYSFHIKHLWPKQMCFQSKKKSMTHATFQLMWKFVWYEYEYDI